MRAWRRLLALTVALAAAACATTPSGSGGGVGQGGDRGRLAAEQAALADHAAAAGRLREALWRWRVVEATGSDAASARRQIETLRGRIAAGVAAAEARGEAARRARNEAGARAAYLEALDLEPGRPVAVAALRELETGAVLRDVAREQNGAKSRILKRKAAAPTKRASR